MIRFTLYILAYGLLGAAIGAIGVFILTEGLPEGAIMGGILGGSIGMLVAARKSYGGTTPSYEFEAAGIHDDNLITTARRNLARGAYRDSFAGTRIMGDKIELSARAKSPRRR